MFLNHYPKLHETLIHKFLVETYLYLSNPDFMHEVHQRIMSHIHPTKDHIIVAHSLGTVIAYNLLHQFTNFKIQRFITLGSPLAFKVIQEKLALPIARPPQLRGDWFNCYSPDVFLQPFHSPQILLILNQQSLIKRLPRLFIIHIASQVIYNIQP